LPQSERFTSPIDFLSELEFNSYGRGKSTKEARKGYHCYADEWRKIEKVIEYVYRTGHIKKATWQSFCNFAINCAYDYFKAWDQRRRGLR